MTSELLLWDLIFELSVDRLPKGQGAILLVLVKEERLGACCTSKCSPFRFLVGF